MKKTDDSANPKRYSINLFAWIIAACLVLVFPLSGCGSSQAFSSSSSSGTVTSSNSIEKSSSSSSKGAQTANSVTPSVKAALDEYESFMNDYCDFMKRYSDSGFSASMLSDYSKFMSKYVEVTNKFNAIDSKKFTAADSAYYAEVVARTTQRLSEIM